MKKMISKQDGYEYELLEFIPTRVKQIVLFIHGMQDYKARYIEFARQLSTFDKLVLIPDLRGHGNTEVKGYFGAQNGWMLQVNDLKDLITFYKSQYPVEVVVIGHSMGSLLARSLLKHYPVSMDKLILSGSPSYNPLISKVLPLLRKMSPLKQSKLVHKIVIGGFNKGIKNPRTDYDWLSFNPQNVDDYRKSDYCGFMFTNRGYVDLFELMMDVYDKETKKSKKNIPITFLSGAFDTVINNKISKAIVTLKEWGYNSFQILYSQSRHELFFDYDKQQVIIDIINLTKSN